MVAKDRSQKNASWRHELPSGWWKLYDVLLADLERLDPTFEIVQAKEKFGEFRLYLDSYPPGAHELIDAASRASRRTCQECGATAVLRATPQGFYATVCDEHSEGMKIAAQTPILASFRIGEDGLKRVNRDLLGDWGGEQ